MSSGKVECITSVILIASTTEKEVPIHSSKVTSTENEKETQEKEASQAENNG